MKPDIETQAQILSQKVRHYLITNMGRHPSKAYPWEIFQAVSLALREQVMINWAATVRTMNEKKARRLYFLSMEYLPGRMLVNNISNLHAHGLMRKVVENLGYNYRDVLEMEPDPGLGNGGLGRLASCFLDSLATQKYPAIAYGLRYQYGIFEQQLWDGVQVELPDCWLLNENPWNLRHDANAKFVRFAGALGENGALHDCEEVRALPFDFPIVGYSPYNDYNVGTLRLWSTKESPNNFHLQRYNAGHIGPAAENMAITDVLYPADYHETGKRIRLKQEFLLVSASLQDIIERHLDTFPGMGNFAEKVRIQINDTHPALVVPELMRRLTTHHEMSWERAWETTQEVVGFTNHTLLKEALEEWNDDRLACLLPRQYKVIEKINAQLVARYPDQKEKLSIFHNGQVRMAHLAIYGAHKTNGVARLHGQLLKEQVFPEFSTLFPDKFTYVTNGVTQRHWLLHCNPRLADFISKRIGEGWITDFTQIATLREFAGERSTQEAFLAIKRAGKERLARYLERQPHGRDLHGVPTREKLALNVDALFDVQIKRIHEYKRQLLNVLHAIMLYFELQENPESHRCPRTVIFAGKAAASYDMAKWIVRLIYCVARRINRDPRMAGKLQVVFVENYGVTKAELLMPAADLSEQISTAGKEASGTGNMKLAMNGALTIGTQDGANIEMREAMGERWWPFSFGATAEELTHLHHYSPWEVHGNNPRIKRAVDALKDGTFTENPSEEEALSHLFDALMLENDRYFLLHDLPAYYATQKKVDELYTQPHKWAEYALHNMAGMGPFSTDNAINTYAKEIWGIEPLPVDPAILQDVKQIYKESTLTPNSLPSSA